MDKNDLIARHGSDEYQITSGASGVTFLPDLVNDDSTHGAYLDHGIWRNDARMYYTILGAKYTETNGFKSLEVDLGYTYALAKAFQATTRLPSEVAKGVPSSEIRDRCVVKLLFRLRHCREPQIHHSARQAVSGIREHVRRSGLQAEEGEVHVKGGFYVEEGLRDQVRKQHFRHQNYLLERHHQAHVGGSSRRRNSMVKFFAGG